MDIKYEENYFLRIDYKFSHIVGIKNDEFTNCDELLGDIILYNLDTDHRELIGKIELHFYNAGIGDGIAGVYNSFDRSASTIILGDAIFSYDRQIEFKERVLELVGESFNSNILVIHSFVLFSDFRNKGFGKEIIKGIEESFFNRCGYIALQSFPSQHDVAYKNTEKFKELKLELLEVNKKVAQKNLNNFYEKCGFTKIKNKTNCYIKNIEPI